MFGAVALLAVVMSASFGVTGLRAEPSRTSRLHWVADGEVSSATVLGDTLYIGGGFTSVAPMSGALGSFFALSSSTGAVLPGLPAVDGRVNDIEPDGAGGYYIAGTFTRVNGTQRLGLAHVLANGDLDSVFDPFIGFGHAMGLVTLGPTSVIVGERAPYNGVKAYDRVSGAYRWSANSSDLFSAYGLAVSGSRVIAGGTTYGSVQFPQRIRAVAFDEATGTTLWLQDVSWVNDVIVSGPHVIAGLTVLNLSTGEVEAQLPGPTSSPSSVDAVATDGTTLYVGGSFSNFGGQPRQNLAAIDLGSGALTAWAPTTDGTVQDLAIVPGVGVAASGVFQQVNATARDGLALLNGAGSVTSWAPSVDPAPPLTLAVSGGSIAVGGGPAIANAVARQGLAAFSVSSDTLLPWVPALTGAVQSMASRDGRVFITTTDYSSAVPYTLSAVTDTGAILWSQPRMYSPLATAAGLFAFDTGTPFKLDPATGIIDFSWRPPLAAIGYFIGTDGRVAVMSDGRSFTEVDLVDGSVGGWRRVYDCAFSGQPSCFQRLRTAAIDGGTVHVDGVAFDRRSGRRLGQTLELVNQLAMDDGDLLVARSPLPPPQFGAVPALSVISAEGALLAETTDLEVASGAGVVVSPSDVVVYGLRTTAPSAFSVAVLPRQPATSPYALTWTVAGHQVSLRWTAPAIAPAGYVLEAGSASGLADVARIPLGPSTEFSGLVPDGTYFVRVRAIPSSASATNEVVVVVGCSSAPDPPTRLWPSVAGTTVTLGWAPSEEPSLSGYVLEAGSSPGASDIASIALGADQRHFTAAAPPGLYYLRMRAANACGRSVASEEVYVRVGSADRIPDTPGIPIWNWNPDTRVVTLQWSTVAGASSYVVDVGSGPGRSDLARLTVTAAGVVVNNVPYGLYYVRVRAQNAAGVSPPGIENAVPAFARPGGI